MPTRTRSKARKAKATLHRQRRAKKATYGGESVEFRFLTENAAALEKFPGERLLIHGPKLVAHSANFDDIQCKIERERIQSPFLYYVPKAEEANFTDFVA